jgi:hypothetical protein
MKVFYHVTREEYSLLVAAEQAQAAAKVAEALALEKWRAVPWRMRAINIRSADPELVVNDAATALPEKDRSNHGSD